MRALCAARMRARRVVEQRIARGSPARTIPVISAAEGHAMLCSELMKTDIECVSPMTPVKEAAQKMRDQNIGFLPVCDGQMRPIGTITDRDIAIRMVAEGYPSSTPVETFITYEVISCDPEDDVSYARHLMAQNRISRIICVNRSGRIEGVISLSDLANLDAVDAAQTLLDVARREARGTLEGVKARPGL
jgi:CBS domain-containing protein